MKFSRVILVCTLLLLAAAPSFAEPTCTECLDTSSCINAPGQASRCRFLNGACQTLITSNCIGRSESPVLADWKIASIEISRVEPATGELQKAAIAPAAVAQAQTTPPVPAPK